MLTVIRTGKISTVVIKDQSRIGRDVIEIGLLKRTFDEFNVRFMSAEDGLDTAKGFDIIQENFEQTMTGISNIMRFQTEDIEFELKLLMSKATVEENPRIIEMITEAFPEGRYEFSLNPMLISKRVASNADIMFSPYSELFQWSRPMIDDCKKRSIPLKMDLILLCVMECNYIQDYIGRSWTEIIEFYSDPDVSRPADNHILCERCPGMGVASFLQPVSWKLP